ncbi:hypothetical protein GQ457_17G022050 [Hibiscus cannabinus]
MEQTTIDFPNQHFFIFAIALTFALGAYKSAAKCGALGSCPSHSARAMFFLWANLLLSFRPTIGILTKIEQNLWVVYPQPSSLGIKGESFGFSVRNLHAGTTPKTWQRDCSVGNNALTGSCSYIAKCEWTFPIKLKVRTFEVEPSTLWQPFLGMFIVQD